MTHVIVTDAGFAPVLQEEDWIAAEAVAGTPGTGLSVRLGSEPDIARLEPHLGRIARIRIGFEVFSDGRGFTLARLLRLRGFSGRLRAAGHVIADQYAMARRAGFDEVEIDAGLAARQSEAQWLARADWRAGDYQARLRGRAFS